MSHQGRRQTPVDGLEACSARILHTGQLGCSRGLPQVHPAEVMTQVARASKVSGMTDRKTAEKPSAQERANLGKTARDEVPRADQAFVEFPASRPDPIALLEEQAKTRVPELVPIRYGRMLSSPFAFFRGAALVMASDLATTPQTGLKVQACGDAHMSNFGVFASPERSLVFDVNDFDETLPGPWEWDVKRLAASLAIAGRDRGFSGKERARAVLGAAQSYRMEMRDLAPLGNLDVWYRRGDVDQAVPQLQAQVRAKQRKRTQKELDKAKTRDSLSAFRKLTETVDGEPRIVSDPPLVVPLAELMPGGQGEAMKELLTGLLGSYRRTLQSDRNHLVQQFRVVDMARKVVGVGSVGTRAWIILLVGRDHGDPLFLQAKEAEASVLERFVRKSSQANHGERVVAGQHLMQASSDIFLGWDRVAGLDGVRRDFYVRQLRDWKGSVDPGQMVPTGMELYGQICGRTLARAHARSGDRIAIATYLGGSPAFEQAIVSFAETYADQNERDYVALQQAVAKRRITAKTGL
jgi:uncharacterized protein (DUF2252 family)